jgi:hypothetical protein
MQRSRSKFFVTSSTLSLQDARVFCNTVYSLLAYPPASLVKSTFIGSASRSSVFIVFPNFLKSSLFPCVSRAALFQASRILAHRPWFDDVYDTGAYQARSPLQLWLRLSEALRPRKHQLLVWNDSVGADFEAYPICLAGLGSDDCNDIEGAGHGDVIFNTQLF